MLNNIFGKVSQEFAADIKVVHIPAEHCYGMGSSSLHLGKLGADMFRAVRTGWARERIPCGPCGVGGGVFSRTFYRAVLG